MQGIVEAFDFAFFIHAKSSGDDTGNCDNKERGNRRLGCRSNDGNELDPDLFRVAV
jgi:hypothetical protein